MLREDLSLLLKSVLIGFEAIQKREESSPNFSKVLTEFQDLHQPIGKKAWKNPEKEFSQ